MTINEAISKIDRLCPNEVGISDKLDWLSEVDQRVYDELIMTHEHDDDIEEFEKYTEEDMDKELLAEDGYNVFYLFYMMAQIDLLNMETDRYNAHATTFSDSFSSYERKYNRKHMPLTEGRIEVR